ncbi:tetratricopeptide repeat protein [Altererythrobacter sp. FM1]|uniref:Tetratricopeptide repeat protein n=1 Tax=Tsuneonella flava TaxID=2055955 RepID=A0ABX7K5G6_9SPHN|nr:tetratricopeptide repeat protein [Tsuneonella flava]QSB43470.1 tetratricopeptide repeat protein [Tsuneonella flava]ROT94808.1 tetratricopeptide repeat protein [Altererythrobacter sp. FM1]
MTYLPIILLAVLALGFAIVVLRLPRSAWTLFAAALVFGLAGYALQGSPGFGGSPRAAVEDPDQTGGALVEARRSLFGPNPPSSYVTMADGFARQGQFATAAGILRSGVDADPNDTEAWIALGNALVQHADGRLSPAALYSYAQARKLEPDSPGPGFFLGVAMIRGGDLADARALWADMIARAPADAEWREQLQQRLDMLDALIARMNSGKPTE